MSKEKALTLQDKIYKAQRLSLYLAKLLQEIADAQQATSEDGTKIHNK